MGLEYYEYLCCYDKLHGHSKYVTAIVTAGDVVVSSSRDKSLIAWTLNKEDRTYGVANRLYTGHSHFSQNIALSSDGQVAAYASSIGKIHFWDLHTGYTDRRPPLVGHTKSVLSLDFSSDNSQIVSASRDKTIRLWNAAHGECESTIHADSHVSCVRFSPDNKAVVSGCLDRTVKVWDLSNHKMRCVLAGHNAAVKLVALSPDGSMCASSGEDNEIILWDLSKGKRMFSFKLLNLVTSICFSPNRYWVCAATETGLLVWDLDRKTSIDTYDDIFQSRSDLYFTSLSWSEDGNTLFIGESNGVVEVSSVKRHRQIQSDSDSSDY